VPGLRLRLAASGDSHNHQKNNPAADNRKFIFPKLLPMRQFRSTVESDFISASIA
jgi:hypothetical protein